MRKIKFINGEIYHVYNRGVDKRNIFSDNEDFNRFIKSILEFRGIEPIGSLYEKARKDEKQKSNDDNLLVEFVAYCINPNHFHFILRQLNDEGIQKFMHKLSTGYTMYFNEKENRSGPLFGGKYKAKEINENDYLLNLSAYVNLNDTIHQIDSFGGSASKFVSSSWNQYSQSNYQPKNNFDIPCETKSVLEQFDSVNDYKKFAEETAKIMREKKIDERNDGLFSDE